MEFFKKIPNIRFMDQGHVRMPSPLIVSKIGRRTADPSPIVVARLDDGSRVCAVIAKLPLIGPVMSIRRFGKKLLQVSVDALNVINSNSVKAASYVSGPGFGNVTDVVPPRQIRVGMQYMF